MHRILLLLSETFFIFYQFEVFNPIDDIFVVSASNLNCCFYHFVILSYILYSLTFCIFNLYRTFLKTTFSERKLPNNKRLLLLRFLFFFTRVVSLLFLEILRCSVFFFFFFLGGGGGECTGFSW